MALFFADLVREFSSSAGAGDFVLDGAVPGHRRFGSVVPAGTRFHYCIAGVTRPDEWEVGEGELAPDGMLVRSAVLSSAGGGLVAFAPGLKSVAMTVAADWFTRREEAVTGIADVAGLGAALDGKAALSGAAMTGPLSAPSLALGTPLALADGGTGAVSAAAARAALGLGAAAVKGIGQSGDAVPLCNGEAVRWAAGAHFGGNVIIETQPGEHVFCFLHIAGQLKAYMAVNALEGGLYVSSNDGAIHIEPQIGNVAATFTAQGLAIAGRCEASGEYRVNGARVLGPRIGGWGAASGAASRASFDTASVGTAELAQRVKALIDDLTAHGLIGS